MSTRTPNKTDSVEVLAHQLAQHPTTILGSAIDASTVDTAVVFLYHGYIESTPDTNYGEFLVQVRPDNGAGTVTENWVTVQRVPAAGTTPDTEAMTASEPAGETTLAVANTAGFAVGDNLYIRDTGTLADSEWAELKTFVNNTNVQLIDGLTNAKDNADVIFNDATKKLVVLDLRGIESYRVVWTHEGATGADGHVKAIASHYTGDNIA